MPLSNLSLKCLVAIGFWRDIWEPSRARLGSCFSSPCLALGQLGKHLSDKAQRAPCHARDEAPFCASDLWSLDVFGLRLIYAIWDREQTPESTFLVPISWFLIMLYDY